MKQAGHVLQLCCRNCSWVAICDEQEMARRLWQVKMLRRDTAPDRAVLLELFQAAADKFQCDECGVKDIVVEPCAKLEDEWGEARKCENCGRTIPDERLALFPKMTRCARCQTDMERGGRDPDVEYCPRCGSPMKLISADRGGMTRYVMKCGQCGR
jgi:hypothetical protein